MAFKFLHASDLHLDTPFSQLGRAAPHVATVARGASIAAFEELVRVAIANHVAFVVLAGDIYDGVERGLRAQLAFHRGVTQLAEAGIHTLVASGNHDPLDEGWKAVHAWPDLVTFFPAHEPASVEITQDGNLLAVVHGISFHQREVTDNLALRFERDGRNGVHIAVLHANVGNNATHSPYSPAALNDLLSKHMDYWALGHIHARTVLHRHPWVVYPGNIQGRSLKPSERGAKGALLVEVDDLGHIAEPKFVPLDVVRFVEKNVDIGDLADIGSLRSTLVEAASDSLGAGGGRNIILRVRLVGRGSLHHVLGRVGVLEALLQELREETHPVAPFVWWAGLVVATHAEWDIDDLTQRNDFVADLARHASDIDPATLQLDSTLPADLPQILGEELSVGLDAETWQAATALAIDLVVGPEE